ncbi:MAG: flagellar M-ring protein FliF [Candidatus Petromonas sp.]|jgi:flagellar M-ring protein FliF|nr:flagellar M-ring protein FliF [Candidatus Petromonas sp.]
MGDSLGKIRNQLNEYFQSLDKKQKVKIGLGSFFLILSISLSIFYFTRPNYVKMYTGLSLEEAGEITRKLDEMNIPWKENNGGTTILVPKESVNKARMDLAIEGFPSKGITWQEAFNNNSFTMTNEDKRLKYLMAEMNSLAETIKEINGVEDARVHLTVPDNDNFLTEQFKYSKASVFLSLKPGFRLTPQQVNGIVMLVSNAVEGLKPENVSVHDETGSVLNQSSKDTTQFTINNQIDLQHEIRSRLENNITKLLSRIYGSDNVDVMVNVSLDFNKEVTNITEFSPPLDGETAGLIRSMAELKEQVINGTEGGPPGTDSNSEAITKYNEINADGSKYIKENKQVNYELNEIRKDIVKAPGQIKNITVAVILNKKSLVNGELTDEHKQELINLISAAAGLETKVVEVMAQDFNNSSQDQIVTVSSGKKSEFLNNLPVLSIGIISSLIIIGAIFLVYRIKRRKNKVDEILQQTISDEVDDVEEIDLDVNDKSTYKYQIEKFVDKKPEAVAQLLRSWLNED